MTLQLSGPISLFDVADEFGKAHSTPFPSGFYGLGGAAASGPLSLEDFYGRSNFAISADITSINLSSTGQSQTAHFTATNTTIASITLISGSGGGRVTLGGTGSSSTTITASTPSVGNGTVNAVYRVATVDGGKFVDLTIALTWGTG